MTFIQQIFIQHLQWAHIYLFYLFIFLFIFFVVVAISWGAPAAYGSSQARGQIRAAASGLHHSHSNARSEPHLKPTPQLVATPDP